jgi:hypothetical protein
MSYSTHLSKTHPSSQKEHEEMTKVPYASAMRLNYIRHAMYSSQCVVSTEYD